MKIGSKYLATLELIKYYLLTDTFYKQVALIYINDHKSRCDYDKCPLNKTAYGLLCILYKNSNIRFQLFGFHERCLDLLCNDSRFLSLN